MQPLVLSASSLIGDDVRNPEGEDLGKLEEIMIDVDTGQVGYAVVSFGGFLGMGDKLFAVPWRTLRIDTDEHELVLDLPREVLENAPGMDRDEWPSTTLDTVGQPGVGWEEVAVYWDRYDREDPAPPLT